MISLIVCVDKNGAIGIDGDLGWDVREDMAFFRKTTIHKPVLMGRKTWDSIEERFRPLKNRKNYVLSSNKSIEKEGATVISGDELDAFIQGFKGSSEELMIMGGASLYEALQEHVDVMYLTSLDFELHNADSYFEIKELKDFDRVMIEDDIDDYSGIPYRIYKYTRK